MRQLKIGKTCIEVKRQTGHDEIRSNVVYSKLLSKIADDDPYVLQAKRDSAWVFAEVVGSISMSSTIVGWQVPLYTDPPEKIYQAFDSWNALDGGLRELIVREVKLENAPINNANLVPPDLLLPEEREDPKSEPPGGGKSRT